MDIFTADFSPACVGATMAADHDGFTFTAKIYEDNDTRAPWDDCGHGPVTDWTTRDKLPGELILSKDGQSKRYYDYAEACKIALRDGWRSSEDAALAVAGADAAIMGTKRQIAARAAMADYLALKAWSNDDWRYVGVGVTVARNGVALVDEYHHALWGVDCGHPNGSDAYLKEVANELASEAIETARATLAKLCDCAHA